MPEEYTDWVDENQDQIDEAQEQSDELMALFEDLESGDDSQVRETLGEDNIDWFDAL